MYISESRSQHGEAGGAYTTLGTLVKKKIPISLDIYLNLCRDYRFHNKLKVCYINYITTDSSQ